MDLAVSTSSFGQEDLSWLGSKRGVNSARTVTIDKSKLTAGTHYPNGYLPAGTPLAKVTATGLYAPYTTGAADGTQTLQGFLLTAVTVGVANPVAPLLDTGRVVTARLPFAVDAAGQSSNARFVFV